MTFSILVAALCIIAGSVMVSPDTAEEIFQASCNTIDPLKGNTGI